MAAGHGCSVHKSFVTAEVQSVPMFHKCKFHLVFQKGKKLVLANNNETGSTASSRYWSRVSGRPASCDYLSVEEVTRFTFKSIQSKIYNTHKAIPLKGFTCQHIAWYDSWLCRSKASAGNCPIPIKNIDIALVLFYIICVLYENIFFFVSFSSELWIWSHELYGLSYPETSELCFVQPSPAQPSPALKTHISYFSESIFNC